jgi:alcohol dehydrogenase class IV
MDALTHLIEAFVSPKASPCTDALIEQALSYTGRSLVNAVFNGAHDLDARIGMSYASCISGIALANAGLGVVHGLASLIGAYVSIPHGVVCGTLLSESVKSNITALERVDPDSIALKKYARAANLLLNSDNTDERSSLQLLIKHLDNLTETLSIPRLSAYGITLADIDRFLVENVNKNNPVQLDNDVIRKCIAARI